MGSVSPDFIKLQATIFPLQDWILACNVTINLAKTVVMHLHFPMQNNVIHTITLGPDILQVVKAPQLIGVTVIAELSWNAHAITVTRVSILLGG